MRIDRSALDTKPGRDWPGGKDTLHLMKKLHTKTVLIPVLAAAVLAGGCGSRKASTGTAKYARPPIQEVSEEQLATDGRLIDALALQQSGRADEALEAYAALAHDHTDCAAAWYGMGRLLIARGWTDSALACIDRAVAADGDNLWYLRLKADVQSRMGDRKAEAATRERIAGLEPGRLENFYDLSQCRFEAGDAEGAVEALNRVEKVIGVSEPVSLQKQRIWTTAGRPDKAEKEIEALAEAMPQEKRYSAILAELNMQRGRYAKAKQYYDRILAADPDDEYIHIQLAEYYKRTGKPDKADREMEAAFDNPELDCGTKVQLLAQFYTNDEFYGSRRGTTFGLLEKAMRQCDDSAAYALVYGDVLMRQQKYAEATRWIELSLRNDSSRYEVWEALLICLAQDTAAEERLSATAARAERLFPTHTLPYYLQALHAMRRDRHDEAIAKLERAAKWGFTGGYLEADSYGLMAECYYRTGRYADAWRAFDRCLALRPDDWGTMNNYAYYLAEQGTELEKALGMSRRTIEAEPDNANSLDTYAWLLHLLGRDKEALPYMQRAVRLDPKSDTLKHHLETIKSNCQ